MAVNEQQETLTGPVPGLRRRVWCRGCRRLLSDPESVRRGWGAECDPDTRNAHERRDVDQDRLPGM